MKIKVSKKPKLNDERIIKKFLLLPIKIGAEIRWLENVKIRQVYEVINWYGDSKFINKEWID